jgi:NTE family protein
VSPPEPSSTAGDIVKFLEAVPLFGRCDGPTLSRLAAAARLVPLAAGEMLFRQGDAADSLAVVRRGRLEVVVGDGASERRATTVGAGGLVGELALLTRTARSSSVRAVRDSELVVVAAEGVEAMLARSPAAAMALVQDLAGRLRRSVDLVPPSDPRRVFALMGARSDLPIRQLAAGLAAELGRSGPVGCIEANGAEADGGPSAWARLVDDAERRHECVLLTCEHEDSPAWARFVLRSADRVVVVAGAGTAGEADPVMRARDLVLVDVPRRAAALGPLLDGFAPRSVQHVSRDGGGQEALRVLARRLTGHSIGIVLSGGGARGFAHIGVIGRLLEAGITIDRVGGCSMGALIGALFASGLEAAEMRNACRRELVDANPFNDWCVPRVSLIRARKAAAMLERLFGRRSLEELERSLFVVSADLVNSGLVVRRRGRVADAVGASMTLPGFAPPRLDVGRLLVDGGVLNGLPVDVMELDDDGPIVAVDVLRHAGAVRPRAGGLPSLRDTLAAVTALSGFARAETNRGRADVLIAPEVDSIGLMRFEQIDRAVEAGRRAADAALADGLARRLDARRTP